MSRRSELRAQAMARDGGCVWPECGTTAWLEMAHLQQLSQVGPDELWNVVMLCKHHHDVLDNRVAKGRRAAIVTLLSMWLTCRDE